MGNKSDKKATTKISTCAKDTHHLVSHLNTLGTAEDNEHLCNADALKMCLSTCNEESLAALLVSCETNLANHAKNLPIK